MDDKNIEAKFESLMSKLEEVNFKLNETLRSIKEGLIPSFEKSVAEMHLALNKLVDRNEQFIKRIKEQTEFLGQNFKLSIQGIKAIFDVNKIESILKRSEEINKVIEEDLKDIDFKSLANKLKYVLEKIERVRGV
ncbi:MAG: hypothetical protein ACTSYR_01560 [Candidatus Odinarchaeia archaeon]